MMRFLAHEAGDNLPPLPPTKSRVVEDILISLLPVKEIDAGTLGIMETADPAMNFSLWRTSNS